MGEGGRAGKMEEVESAVGPKDHLQAFGADGLRVLELLNVSVVSLAELRVSKKEKKKSPNSFIISEIQKANKKYIKNKKLAPAADSIGENRTSFFICTVLGAT